MYLPIFINIEETKGCRKISSRLKGYLRSHSLKLSVHLYSIMSRKIDYGRMKYVKYADRIGCIASSYGKRYSADMIE